MLTYLSKSSLLAAHAAGQKFEVIAASGSRYTVESMRSEPDLKTVTVKCEKNTEFRHIRPDGTAAGFTYRMVKKTTQDVYPRVSFVSVDAARGAVAAGIKLVADLGGKGALRSVESVRVNPGYSRGTPSLGCTFVDGGFAEFNLDGSHVSMKHWSLMVAEPAKTLTEQLREKLDIPAPHPYAPFPATQTTPAKRSVLEAYFAGEQLHTLHTREYVVGVKHERNANRLIVTLRDENGKERDTPRYNLDGTHKFQPVRNLVVGKLPPKPPVYEDKQVNVTIYKHAFDETLFVIRDGEVLPNIRGISNATKVGSTVIVEKALVRK
jgi:hypothetical protein